MSLLVAFHDALMTAGPVNGREAQLVDHQQGDAQVALVEARERALVARLDQFVDEIGGADEGDPLLARNGFDPECDREMRLGHPDQPGDREVLAEFEIVARGELGELRPFDPAQQAS